MNTIEKNLDMDAKKYLKSLNSAEFEQIAQKSFLTDEEYWILRYSILQNRMVENICDKLNLSKSSYHNKKNIALAKVTSTINYLIGK